MWCMESFSSSPVINFFLDSGLLSPEDFSFNHEHDEDINPEVAHSHGQHQHGHSHHHVESGIGSGADSVSSFFICGIYLQGVS